MMQEPLTALVQRAVQGDEDAFWQIYEMKWKGVLYTALKMLGNLHDASDAAQETFVSAHQNIRALRSPDAFNGWFYRILVNKCNAIKNMKKKHVSYEEDLMKEYDKAVGGTVYRLEDRQEPIPKAYQLTNLYESWQTFP